jgi:hypothetical protein
LAAAIRARAVQINQKLGSELFGNRWHSPYLAQLTRHWQSCKTHHMKSLFRRLLFISLGLVVLVALFYAEEDWRGKRAWENYKREWEAKGEKFDWQAFVPPAVPNDQNFFTAPIFTNMLNGKIEMTPYGNDGGPDFRRDASQSGYAIYREHLTDFQAWQNYYRHQTNTDVAKRFPVAAQPQTPAKDVLFALSIFDSSVEELREASERPYSNVPSNYYEDGFNSVSTLLPVLGELKRCSQVLQLRAVAELADGQSAKALDDVKLLLRLNDSLRNSPFLISHLVRIAIVSIGIQPIWEGLAEHRWSDAQLAELDSELAKTDFLADYGFIMRSERAFSIKSFENLRHTREMISNTDAGIVTNKLTFMPSAYFYRNELAIARMQQQWILPLVDTNMRVISPAALQRANDAFNTEMKHYSPYKVQALRLFPAIGKTARSIATLQASIDLARVACALERYRLAHGQYPETLDALAPQFIGKLPHDIINGQPLHYRRTDDGTLVLYSVGWNESDDGGKIVFEKGSVKVVDREKGDWVWQYPVK